MMVDVEGNILYDGNNGHLRYLETAVETAHPARLVVMLYDGAIRFLNGAEDAMKSADYERQNHFIIKAQRIVAELMSSLDMHKGAHIAENLLNLYAYIYNQLIEANLGDQVEVIGHVRQLLQELREAWDEVAYQAEMEVPVQEVVKVSLHG
jgi:flagellar protein FliS